MTSSFLPLETYSKLQGNCKYLDPEGRQMIDGEIESHYDGKLLQLLPRNFHFYTCSYLQGST